MTPKINSSAVRLFRIPTEIMEADGTYQWTATTMVFIEISAGGCKGVGYTYADDATGAVARNLLREIVHGKEAFAHTGIWLAMTGYVRNLGATGIAQMAISAIDNALWDLRARLCNCSLVRLLGYARDAVPVYGSGGFTSYNPVQLGEQLGQWADAGFGMVKLKVGTQPGNDIDRVKIARAAVGDRVKLFVDANGAYTLSQALHFAEAYAALAVSWFEEPVSSDNLDGLRHLVRRAPAGMDIAAGEYGYTAWYFRRMLDQGAVTVLQADATRCGGITGFLNAGALCWSADAPLSSHCAPSMHLHVCCSVPRVVHMEFFHDHARIERMLFEGFCEPRQGMMSPDQSRPGVGLELKEQDAVRYLVN